MMETPEVMRGYQFWTDEIKKAGVFDKIPPFNDLITGKTKTSENISPVLENIKLGGKTVDIYHWGEASGRIYIHIKD